MKRLFGQLSKAEAAFLSPLDTQAKARSASISAQHAARDFNRTSGVWLTLLTISLPVFVIGSFVIPQVMETDWTNNGLTSAWAWGRFIYFGLVVLFIVLFWAPSRRVMRRLALSRQRLADNTARDILGQLHAGTATPTFSLYLRAFMTTDQYRSLDYTKMKKAAARDAALSLVPFNDVAKVLLTLREADGSKDLEPARELELALAKSVQRFGPLICLGLPLEHRGAGRAQVSDDAWQEAVRLMCAKADIIILAPSERPGTRWEVDYVLENGLIDRCVVINLPDREKLLRNADKRAEWEGIREKFLRHG